MAIDRIVGHNGSVTMPSGVHGLHAKRWNIDVNIVTSDVTAFGDSTQQNITGIDQYAWGVSGVPGHDDANSNVGIADRVATGSALTLLYATGTSYAFAAAAFNNFGLASEFQGDATVSMSGVNGIGTITETWDETA